jgi:hypothetical protein
LLVAQLLPHSVSFSSHQDQAERYTTRRKIEMNVGKNGIA